MKRKFLLLLCLLIPSYTAIAEGGCPPGMYPPNPANTSVCYPFPESQQTAPVQQPQAPRGHWETRWGSIAVDGVRGKLGGVINHKTKQAAEKAALAECYSTYYNQCSAVAWGDSKYTGSGRATIEEASQDAMQGCSEATSNCVVVYNACSNAKWISY
jgi:Domain of unknown function (DUF4189)